MPSMSANITAAATYDLQRDRDFAWSRLAGCGDPDVLTPAERSDYNDRKREYEVADAAFTAAAEAIGGRVYRVPVANIDKLTKRVEKINRRAAKLEVEPVHYVVTTETWDKKVLHEITGEVKYIIPHVFVIVGFQVVKLAGWRFAATIEHDEEAGNIIRQVPSVEADLTEYRTAAPYCSHCKTVRNRIDTFVVLHDDGNTAQIGRNCLVDFLGAKATSAASQAEWLNDLETALGDAEDSESLGGAFRQETIDLEEYLTHVVTMIRANGWTSRGTAYDYGRSATADSAAANLRECRKADYREPGHKEYHVLPSEQDAEEAKIAIEWARETYGAKPIEERTDFEHNMAVAVAHDYLPTRRQGLAAYAIQARRKAIEIEVKEKVKAEAKATSDYVGTVGEKLTTEVTVARVVELEDRYSYNGGTKPLYEMVDDSGNIIKWFASNWSADLKAGQRYRITATVKAHDDGINKYDRQASGDKAEPRYPKSTKVIRVKAEEIA